MFKVAPPRSTANCRGNISDGRAISLYTVPNAERSGALARAVASLYTHQIRELDAPPSEQEVLDFIEEDVGLDSTLAVGLLDPDQLASFGVIDLLAGSISHLAVAPELESSGAGRLTLRHLERLAIRAGRDTIYLRSLARAVDFYKKRGYRLDPTSADDRSDRVNLRKHLY